MAHTEQFREFLDRAEEANVYLHQGLADGAMEILEEILNDLETGGLSDAEKAELRSRIEAQMGYASKACGHPEPPVAADGKEGSSRATSSLEIFNYGLALMDGQFWDEAIEEFKRAAVAGELAVRCWELCGDCSTHLEDWKEAIRYYEIVYADPSVPDRLKQQVLLKITRCSQTNKKMAARASVKTKSNGPGAGDGLAEKSETQAHEFEPIGHSLVCPDQSSVCQLLGGHLHSWLNEKGESLTPNPCSYRVTNLLHVGSTSTVVELEKEGTKERFAGQGLAEPFTRFLSPKALACWAHSVMMMESRHLVRVWDLAHSDELFFIVREHLPLSLVDVVSAGEFLPIPIAVSFAYHILEGLGDLHLHKGLDDTVRNLFHLDLRPSRILLCANKCALKINNGGLWKELASSAPKETAVKRLPLPFLSYRAPEQFRPYLARKKPPVFTDIYLFGALFYEMLAGVPAFRASSFEEYEIQHCDQYPTPPKVWRPEIPDDLNDMIMKCLDRDPFKRWRSTTQMSLILEKAYGGCIHAMRDGTFARYLDRSKSD